MQYRGSLRARELGQAQAPMLLVFLTPRQALSSHLRVFIMNFWESMNFHPDQQFFQVAGAKDRTTDPWVTSSMLPLPPTPRGTPVIYLPDVGGVRQNLTKK